MERAMWEALNWFICGPLQRQPTEVVAHLDDRLVALSITVAFLGSYTALDLLEQVRLSSSRLRSFWFASTSLALGIAIWAMHFIAILAHRLALPITFDFVIVGISIVVAVSGSMAGLAIALRGPPGWRTVMGAGTIVGLAIVGMHFSAMSSLRVAALPVYLPVPVIVSALIAIGCATLALWMSTCNTQMRRFESGWKLLSGVVLATAIVVMHFVAMAGTTYQALAPNETQSAPVDTNQATLATIVGVGAVVLLILALLGSVFGRNLSVQTARAEALQQSEARFRSLIQHASDVVGIAAVDLRLNYISPAVTTVLGYDPSVWAGQPFLELVHPDDRSIAQRLLNEAPKQLGISATAVCRLQHADHSWRSFELIVNNLLDEASVQGIVITCRDVSERNRLQAELLQAQKMESIGRLAGGIAHDFNNLLTAISGYTQVVLEEPTLPSVVRDDINEINVVVQRASNLTRQLLAFARRQPVELRPTNLNDIVATTTTMLRRLLGANMGLELNLAPDLERVSADSGQLEQVLTNLVINARDAMPNGGVLTIATGNVGPDDEQARAEAGLPCGLVFLSVGDTGTGMDEQVKQRVFEPFFTTKKSGQGTGLGLATSYGIVQQHGGHIAVRTALGQGTTVVIYLPTIASAASPATVAPERPVVAPHETVVVVDDEENIRTAMAQVLRGQGYTVLEAANGAAALEAVTTNPVDLVITDINMPVMDGIELVARLREAYSQLPILFVSGGSFGAERASDESFGSIPLLEKPWTPSQFAYTVRCVLDGTPIKV